jgi:hypothetical protein
MLTSRQLDLLIRLTTHFEGITPANGYSFDLTGKVFRGRLVFGADDPDPVVSIVEHLSADISVDVAGENRISRAETWVLLVQGWIRIIDEHPTDEAYNLKAAVEHRLARCIQTNGQGQPLYPDEYFLGLNRQGVTGITIGPGVVSAPVRPDASQRAFFYLPVGIGWAADVSDPFVEAVR